MVIPKPRLRPFIINLCGFCLNIFSRFLRWPPRLPNHAITQIFSFSRKNLIENGLFHEITEEKFSFHELTQNFFAFHAITQTYGGPLFRYETEAIDYFSIHPKKRCSRSIKKLRQKRFTYPVNFDRYLKVNSELPNMVQRENSSPQEEDSNVKVQQSVYVLGEYIISYTV